MPAVVGYLAVGLAVSPFTPGWVADPDQLHLLADIGVVLLLFEVGIEIDLFDFRREQRGLIWAAPIQMVVTSLVGVAVGWPPASVRWLGPSWGSRSRFRRAWWS